VGKLKMRGMQSNAVDQMLFCFRGLVFSVTDDRVAQGGKLCANLVL
jgi:hypothetical protein